MTETRIEVHQSDVKTIYIPQYKAKDLCFSWWENFSANSTDLEYAAQEYAICCGHAIHTKEYAECVCRIYQDLKFAEKSRIEDEDIHRRTNKVSHYKYP